jgi:hypothetical protein
MVLANCNRGEGSKVWEIKDFMPDYESEARPKQTMDQTKTNILMLHAAMGGGMPTEGGD